MQSEMLVSVFLGALGIRLLGERRPMAKIKRRIVLAAGLVMLAPFVVFSCLLNLGYIDFREGDIIGLISMALGAVGLLTAWLALVSYRDRDISKTAIEGQESRSQDE